MPDLTIRPLPALRDNYIWLISLGRQAVVVDPGEAEPVLHALRDNGLQLAAILLTHHHADHTGGVSALTSLKLATVASPSGRLSSRICRLRGMMFLCLLRY